MYVNPYNPLKILIIIVTTNATLIAFQFKFKVTLSTSAIFLLKLCGYILDKSFAGPILEITSLIIFSSISTFLSEARASALSNMCVFNSSDYFITFFWIHLFCYYMCIFVNNVIESHIISPFLFQVV